MLLRKMPLTGDVEGMVYNMKELVTHVCSVLVKNQLHSMWKTNGSFRKDVEASASSHRTKEIRIEQRHSSWYFCKWAVIK